MGGIEPGRLLTIQLVAVAMAQLCLTILVVVRSAREEARLGLLPAVTLTGHFLSLALYITLFSMEDYATYLAKLHRLLGIVAAEGIVMALFMTAAGRIAVMRRERRERQ